MPATLPDFGTETKLPDFGPALPSFEPDKPIPQWMANLPTESQFRKMSPSQLGMQGNLSGESLIGISPEDIPSGAGTTHPEITIPISATGKAAAGVGQFLTSPKGITEVALAATPAAPVVYAKWAYDMIKGGVTSVTDLTQKMGQMITEHFNAKMVTANQLGAPEPLTPTAEQFQGMAEDAVNAALMFTGAAGIAGHLAPRSLSALSTLQKGAPDAIHAQTAQVLRPLRDQPRESPRQMPEPPAGPPHDEGGGKAPGPEPEKIVAAAVNINGRIETGNNHPEILERNNVGGFDTRESRNTPAFGFVTDKGRFISRQEAGPVATKAGQNLDVFEPGEQVHSDQVESPVKPGVPLGEANEPALPSTTPIPEQPLPAEAVSPETPAATAVPTTKSDIVTQETQGIDPSSLSTDQFKEWQKKNAVRPLGNVVFSTAKLARQRVAKASDSDLVEVIPKKMMGGTVYEIVANQKYYDIVKTTTPASSEAGRGAFQAPASSPPVGTPSGGNISEGPGAASPGDVPPEPPRADAGLSENRPMGIVAPEGIAIGNVSKLLQATGTELNALAGESMPKTTAANRQVGEAGVRYASSRVAAKPLADTFSSHVLEGTDVDPFKFGAALVEDNLRSVREGFRQKATELRAEGKEAESLKAEEQANQVTSLIGANRSPFRTEDEYQDYLNSPEVRQAFENHKQLWQEVIDPQFKAAQGIDPDVELASRGQQTGARINLKALFEDEPAERPVGGTGFPSLTATFKRKSPFGMAAKGTGQSYEASYPALMRNTFERQLEIANKNSFDKLLVESGLAVIDRPGANVSIGGQTGVAFPLSRRRLIVEGKEGTKTFSQAQNIYVRKDIANEYRIASNVDPRMRIPYVTKSMDVLNKAALAGLTDFTVHTSNLMTRLFNRPMTGELWRDSFLSAMGRSDIPIALARAIIKSTRDNRAQVAELAEIGAMRPGSIHGRGPLSWSGRILRKMDETVRLTSDDAFQDLVRQGIVENTETARREYINEIGQYNRRLQGPFMRFAKDTGFGPFATAGRSFGVLGVKMVTLSPGVRGTGIGAEASLRANVLSKWVGAAVLAGTMNYLLTKDKGGGVMGRPGTPIGTVDTGLDDKAGKPLRFPLFDVIGLGRGLRVTGIKGAVEAKRLSLNNSLAADAAARDIINSWIGPFAGPPIRFGVVAASGYPPAINVGRAAPVAIPGQSQFRVNVEQALKDANPVVATMLDVKEGKPLDEAMTRQLPRFTLQPGKPPEMVAKYPKIVGLAQTFAFADWLVGQARKMEPQRRNAFVSNYYRQLDPEQKRMVADALRRRKVHWVYVNP